MNFSLTLKIKKYVKGKWQDISESSRELQDFREQWYSLRWNINLLKRANRSEDRTTAWPQMIMPAKIVHKSYRVCIICILSAKIVSFYKPTYKDDAENWFHRFTACVTIKGSQIWSREHMQKYNVGFFIKIIVVEHRGTIFFLRQ